MSLTRLPTAPAVTPLLEGCVDLCPGCRHRALSAHQSEVQKEAWLRQRLAPWQSAFAPLRAVGEAERRGYRDKLSLSCEWGPGGWQFGLRRWDELIPIPACPVHSERARNLVQLLAQVLPGPEQIALAYYVQSGAQITLILKQAQCPPHDWLDAAVEKALQDLGVEGLWVHLNPSTGKRLFAKRGWELLWGQPRSRDGQGLWYGPAAFQQLLPSLHQQSLDEAEAFLAPAPGDPLIDLYCGNGSGLVRWLAAGARVLGVELGAEAVACAALNAPQAQVLRGCCAQRVPQLEDWSKNRGGTGLLYVNPPRTGLEPEVSRWIVESFRPRRLAYLSCSAGTLARDLELLSRGGYQVARLRPYDFFPGTQHVETLALLALPSSAS